MPRKNCDTSFEKRQLVIYNKDRINRKPRSGRPEKLSLQDKRILLRQMQREPTVSAEELSRNFTPTHGKKILGQTICNLFKSSGFNSRTTRNKPYISAINKKKRLDFAKKYCEKDFRVLENSDF